MNLSEILVSLKRGWKGKKGYGTPPDPTMAPQVVGQLFGVYLRILNSVQTLISKQHQIFKISYFHEFYKSFEKNYLSPNIPKKSGAKKFTKRLKT